MRDNAATFYSIFILNNILSSNAQNACKSGIELHAKRRFIDLFFRNYVIKSAHGKIW